MTKRQAKKIVLLYLASMLNEDDTLWQNVDLPEADAMKLTDSIEQVIKKITRRTGCEPCQNFQECIDAVLGN